MVVLIYMAILVYYTLSILLHDRIDKNAVKWGNSIDFQIEPINICDCIFGRDLDYYSMVVPWMTSYIIHS